MYPPPLQYQASQSLQPKDCPRRDCDVVIVLRSPGNIIYHVDDGIGKVSFYSHCHSSFRIMMSRLECNRMICVICLRAVNGEFDPRLPASG